MTARPGDEFTRAERAAKSILSKTKLRPRIGLVLGSGLGAFADDFEAAARIDYKKIPYFPRSTFCRGRTFRRTRASWRRGR